VLERFGIARDFDVNHEAELGRSMPREATSVATQTRRGGRAAPAAPGCARILAVLARQRDGGEAAFNCRLA
jgi:hypothetical protein